MVFLVLFIDASSKDEAFANIMLEFFEFNMLIWVCFLDAKFKAKSQCFAKSWR